MHIVLCQLDSSWEDKATSHVRALQLLRATNIPAGSLIVLPEMFATGFSLNVAKIAEEPAGETHQFLQSTAAEFDSMVLGGLVTAHPDGRGRNEALAIENSGQLAARYCKLHPFLLHCCWLR